MFARFQPLAVLLLVLCSACGSLKYDLSDLDFPLRAGPAPAGSTTRPFALKSKSILWVHGLAGHRQPEVAEQIRALEPGPGGIANLRVTQGASFHDWLLTHLSLTLVRMKTVRIEGVVVEGPQDRQAGL